jgi:hypothetical protein
MAKLKEIKNAKQIIRIIKPIPAEQFCVRRYENNIGQCCFLGHIHKHISGRPMGDFKGFGARELTEKFLTEKHELYGYDGADVNNDSNVNGYTEDNPKDRIMHLLNDMVKAGY